MTARSALVAAVGGIVLGVLYTLSPLTVWCAVGFVLLCRAARRGLSPDEQRLVTLLLVVAAVLRVAVVLGLFVTTDHGATPFGSLFGDEEYFKRRSLWLRSMALDVDISNADRIYAIDEYSDTSYLYLLAFLQILVGAAPYGVHVFSILLYLVSAVLLHRLVWRAFGAAPAHIVMAAVLFFPSLFLWSVSALRESVHLLCVALAMLGALEATRPHPWRQRVAWAAAAALAVVALRDLRAGSMAVVGISVIVGVAGGLVAHRPRRLAVLAAVALVAALLAVSRPAIQQRILVTLQNNAMNHQGHVWTPGVHYKLLAPKDYVDRRLGMMESLTWSEVTRFAVKAMVASVLVPRPWDPQTTLTRAYLPEHIVWLALVAILPIGLWLGWRHDPTATLTIATYIFLMGTAVALRSGNIGTLVRHRGLVLPFVICLGAVTVCHALRGRAAPAAPARGLSSNLERTV